MLHMVSIWGFFGIFSRKFQVITSNVSQLKRIEVTTHILGGGGNDRGREKKRKRERQRKREEGKRRKKDWFL